MTARIPVESLHVLGEIHGPDHKILNARGQSVHIATYPLDDALDGTSQDILREYAVTDANGSGDYLIWGRDETHADDLARFGMRLRPARRPLLVDPEPRLHPTAR